MDKVQKPSVNECNSVSLETKDSSVRLSMNACQNYTQISNIGNVIYFPVENVCGKLHMIRL
jgi:hypothetical protein